MSVEMAEPQATTAPSGENVIGHAESLEKRISELETLVKQLTVKTELGALLKQLTTKIEPATDQPSAVTPTKEKTSLSQEQLRYRNIIRQWNKDKGAYEDHDVVAGSEQNQKEEVFRFIRVHDPATGEKGAYSEIEIKNEVLIKLLGKEIGEYPYVNFNTDTVTLQGPFPAIIHNWEKLQARAAQDPETQQSKDLAALLERVQAAPDLTEYFKLQGSTDVTKVVTFQTMWTAFAPGTLVVVRPFMNTEQIMKVQDSPVPGPGQHNANKLWLYAYNWDWDGHTLKRVEHPFKFERFRGTKNVKNLSVIPLDLHDKREELKETARQKAQLFLRYTVQCKPGSEQMLQYVGLGYIEEKKKATRSQNPYGDVDEDSDYENVSPENENAGKIMPFKGAFIADALSYIQKTGSSMTLGHGGREPYIDEQQETEPDVLLFCELAKTVNIKDDLDQANDNFLIFPPRLLGYATKERMWAQISLDPECVSEAKKGDNSIFQNKLELEQRYKDMIESLVTAHVQKDDLKQQIQDPVEGKGKGLVLLLHGPPGVGKTLTAEAIASHTGKPLFVVSVAEIGLDASRAERKLEKIFDLATRWQAVLLIDEADVFLESRSNASPAERNALVSVLLRVLEYYQGIIIMTTNRIRSIDVAVISRIHLAVQYRDLKKYQMIRIFKYYLDQLEPELLHDRRKINEFIEQYGDHFKLNGRQIRNVVMVAQAYASQGRIRHAQVAIQGPPMDRGGPDPSGHGYMERGYPMRGYEDRHEGYGHHSGSGFYDEGYGRGRHGPDEWNRNDGVALLRSDGKMTDDHLKVACRMTLEFQDKLKEDTKLRRFNNEAAA